MTSVTLKTFPEMPVAALSVQVGAEPASDAFWDAITFIVSSAPRLQESNIMGYSYISPAYPYNGSIIGGYLGTLILPNGTVAELQQATTFLQEHFASTPGVQAMFVPIQYPNLYAWYLVNKNVAPIGNNLADGNRLLDGKALSNTTALRATMEKATPPGHIANLNLVAGPGLWAAKPAGGSDSVTPAWRKAYIEYGQ
jgi:hypothetical protein